MRNKALDADCSIGPADLRNIAIGTKFDPLEENMNLAVDATATYIKGSIGIWPFEYSARKNWILAQTRFDTSLMFGVGVPLDYATDKGFTAPSASTISFIRPKLDLENLVRRAVKAAPVKES